jgi:hypothetical protein
MQGHKSSNSKGDIKAKERNLLIENSSLGFVEIQKNVASLNISYVDLMAMVKIDLRLL